MSLHFADKEDKDNVKIELVKVEERINYIDEKIEYKFDGVHQKLDEVISALKDLVTGPVRTNSKKIEGIEKREIKSSTESKIHKLFIIVSLSLSLAALGVNKEPLIAKILALF